MANLARVLLLASIPVSLLADPVTTTIDSGGIFCSPQHGNYSTGFVGGDGSTTATASAINIDPYFEGTPGTCTISVTAELETPGPIRPGFLGFSLNGDANGDLGPRVGWFLVDGVQIGYCNDFGCHSGINAIPMMLGTPFEITVLAVSSALSPTTGGSAYIQATIHAYELVSIESFTFPHDSPIFFATETPEPGTLPLMLLGVGLGAILLWAKRSSGSI